MSFLFLPTERKISLVCSLPQVIFVIIVVVAVLSTIQIKGGVNNSSVIRT